MKVKEITPPVEKNYVIEASQDEVDLIASVLNLTASHGPTAKIFNALNDAGANSKAYDVYARDYDDNGRHFEWGWKEKPTREWVIKVVKKD